MAVNIEIQALALFDCKGNSSVLATWWKKWLQSLQYFMVAKGVANDAQKNFNALLLYLVGIEVQELYEMLTDPSLGAAVEEDSQLPASYLLTYLKIVI